MHARHVEIEKELRNTLTSVTGAIINDIPWKDMELVRLSGHVKTTVGVPSVVVEIMIGNLPSITATVPEISEGCSVRIVIQESDFSKIQSERLLRHYYI